jgi:hypothetical protein
VGRVRDEQYQHWGEFFFYRVRVAGAQWRALVSFRWHVVIAASKQGWRGRCEFKSLWVGGLS